MRDTTEPLRGKVLVVDDEEMVTSNLEMLLRMETSLEPVGLSSAASAVSYLKENPVDAIISDFIMPEMNGLELLAQAKEIQPATSRVLLTGYADKESAIRAINEIGLFHYLEKPWDNAFVLMVVRNAVERSRLLRQLSEKDHSLEEFREKVWRMLI